MYGAIYGDLIGSLYEYREYLLHNKELMIEASKREDLLSDSSFISDDTILTMAVADAYIHGLDYEDVLKRYIMDNSNELNRDGYFKYMFSLLGPVCLVYFFQPKSLKCLSYNVSCNNASIV